MNVSDWGAVPNLDSAQAANLVVFNRVIAAAVAMGGADILVPYGNWYVSDTIEIANASGVRLVGVNRYQYQSPRADIGSFIRAGSAFPLGHTLVRMRNVQVAGAERIAVDGSFSLAVTANANTDAFTAVAHGLPNGLGVRFNLTGTPPAPLVTDVAYYVTAATVDTFQLSATDGGAAINLTTDGSGNQIDVPRAGIGLDITADGTSSAVTYQCEIDGLTVRGIRQRAVHWTYVGAVITATAHGFSSGQRVVPSSTNTLPTGLTAATEYYVVGATTDALGLSATFGGSPIALSGGSGTHSLTGLGYGLHIGGYTTGRQVAEVKIRNVQGSENDIVGWIDGSSGTTGLLFEDCAWNNGLFGFICDTGEAKFVRCNPETDVTGTVFSVRPTFIDFACYDLFAESFGAKVFDFVSGVRIGHASTTLIQNAHVQFVATSGDGVVLDWKQASGLTLVGNRWYADGAVPAILSLPGCSGGGTSNVVDVNSSYYLTTVANVATVGPLIYTHIGRGAGTADVSTTGTLEAAATALAATIVASLRATNCGSGLGHFDGSGNLTSSLAVNADVDPNAGIAGTKVSPNFGSQNVLTSGTLGAGASTLGNTTVGTLGASGAATLAAVACTTLAPSGAANMQAVTCTTLAPSGTATMQGVACTSMAATGNVSAGAGATLSGGGASFAPTLCGFYGVTPAARPAAFTLTYSTGTRTNANLVASPPATTASSQTTPWGFTTQAQADAIPVAIGNLIGDVQNIKQFLTQLAQDLITRGIQQ